MNKLHRQRAGLMHSFLIALILLLVAFGLIVVWMVRAGIIIDDEADVNLCRGTLALQTKTDADLPFMHLNSPFANICKRRFIEMDSDSVTVKGIGKLAVAKKFSVWMPSKANPDVLVRTTVGSTVAPNVDQTVASSVLAESLRRCYTMGLEGNIKTFNRDSFLNSNVCLVCDELRVNLGSQTDIPGNEDNQWLLNYLKKYNVPGSAARDQIITYATFLDYEGAQAENEYPYAQKLRKKLDINTDYTLRTGSYSTIMIRRFGGLFGGKEGTMTVAVVPTAKIRVLCDSVAN